jgi:hemerythrin-like domain-containing protein
MAEIFALHQEALLLQQTQLAQDLLKLYRQVLSEHMDLEDNLLLAQHHAGIGEPRWATRIYAEEHGKIRHMLKELTHRLNQSSVTHRRRWIIEILDYERLLKNVLEHHEEREEEGLLKELDNALPQGEHDELVTHCHLTLQKSFDNIEEDLQQLKTLLPE